MNEFGFWITPLLLIPGIGLLLLSTSIRYNRLHDEVHEIHEERFAPSELVLGQLSRRARIFRNAIVGLYVAVALLALASLIGALALAATPTARWFSLFLTGLSVIAVLYSSTLLVVESRLSLRVILEHLGDGGSTAPAQAQPSSRRKDPL